MRQGVDLEQGNELHLTAEVQQGIMVLGMPATELSFFIQSALCENPFLALDEPPASPAEEGALPDPLDPRSTESLFGRLERHRPLACDADEKQWHEYAFERYFEEQVSLKSHLEEQVRCELDNDTDRFVGSFLIGNIDSNGYLDLDIGEVARSLGLPIERVEGVLQAIQSCQPAGIGARSLGECLKLQLREIGQCTSLAQEILDNHLDDVAAGKLPKIAQQLGVPVAGVQETVDIIRTLNPRPGLLYGSGADETIVPEVVVTKQDDGFSIEVLDLDIPPLAISQEYVGMLDRQDINKETRKYLKECHRLAKSLIGSVEQRKSTLYRISCCIMQMQTDFLSWGLLRLRPITMLEVAEMVGVSESTVSRVVNGNYIQTPHGVFELRMFFSSAASQASANDVSSSSVKQLIKRLVDEEDKLHPLSDAQLVEALADYDVKVSRRTVNKYRNALGIPGTTQRQRY